MCFYRNICLLTVLGLLCSICILSHSRTVWGATVVLDEEAVFSLYYSMDSKGLKPQDIEDYCFHSGKAAFTAYKPSEMFMKHGLKNQLAGIKEQVSDYDDNTLFNWRIKGGFSKGQAASRVILYNNNMPQPTPYINSEISKKGQKLIKKMLDHLVKENPGLNRGEELDIVFSLKPEKVEYRFQKRNIALEDILLPIRYVIFNPVKVEVSDQERTVQLNGF